MRIIKKAISITKSNRQKTFTSDEFTEDEKRFIYNNLDKSLSVRRFVSKRGISSNKTVLIYKTGMTYDWTNQRIIEMMERKIDDPRRRLDEKEGK